MTLITIHVIIDCLIYFAVVWSDTNRLLSGLDTHWEGFAHPYALFLPVIVSVMPSLLTTSKYTHRNTTHTFLWHKD